MSSEIYLEYLRSLPVSNNPYYSYFKNITGRGSEIGDVYSNIPDFQRGYGVVPRYALSTSRVQLGGGIGTWFKNLFQFAKPMLTRGLKGVLDVGTKIANDVIDGENVKSSFKKRVKEKASTSLPPVVSNLVNKTIGSGIRSSSSRQTSVKQKRPSVAGVKKKKEKWEETESVISRVEFDSVI
jgi:hypothetical protein